jgi:hypothetical protein
VIKALQEKVEKLAASNEALRREHDGLLEASVEATRLVGLLDENLKSLQAEVKRIDAACGLQDGFMRGNRVSLDTLKAEVAQINVAQDSFMRENRTAIQFLERWADLATPYINDSRRKLQNVVGPYSDKAAGLYYTMFEFDNRDVLMLGRHNDFIGIAVGGRVLPPFPGKAMPEQQGKGQVDALRDPLPMRR